MMPQINKMQTNVDAAMLITSISQMFVTSDDALAHMPNRPIVSECVWKTRVSNVVNFSTVEILLIVKLLLHIHTETARYPNGLYFLLFFSHKYHKMIPYH